MLPSFSSITFPNHYTLVTGLYPEHHGIVAMSFYDPQRKERYAFNDPKTVTDGSWYRGVPLWSLAEKQGMRDLIKKLDGNLDDGQKVVDALKGFTFDGPRGVVQVDPETRDIIEDEHAEEVYKKPDGKLGIKVLGTVAKVKDPCKELKIGRCADQPK